MSSYCTISDVYRWIPRGSVQNPARLVDVDTTTDTLTLDGHGLESGDEVQFRPESGGALPTGLVEGTSYYALVTSESTFQVAASVGGPAIDLSGTPSNVLCVVQLPWAAWIEEASNEVECTMPAHVVPLSAPYPAVVVAYTAGLVAETALAYSGVASASIADRLTRVRAELATWRKQGVPIRGAVRPASSNLAIVGSRATDPRGWIPSGGGLP